MLYRPAATDYDRNTPKLIKRTLEDWRLLDGDLSPQDCEPALRIMKHVSYI